MLNRRKAMIGWLAYQGLKRVVKRVVRSRTGVGGRSKVPAAVGVGAAAALFGALMLWRRRRSDREETAES